MIVSFTKKLWSASIPLHLSLFISSDTIAYCFPIPSWVLLLRLSCDIPPLANNLMVCSSFCEKKLQLKILQCHWMLLNITPITNNICYLRSCVYCWCISHYFWCIFFSERYFCANNKILFRSETNWSEFKMLFCVYLVLFLLYAYILLRSFQTFSFWIAYFISFIISVLIWK